MEQGAIDRRWKRVAVDLFATTGLTLFLHRLPGSDDWWDVDVLLDGRAIGSFGRSFPSDEEEFIVALVDYLCEFSLDEDVWGGWPVCPDHETHPLQPSMDGNHTAVWRCPVGRMVAQLGQLRQ